MQGSALKAIQVFLSIFNITAREQVTKKLRLGPQDLEIIYGHGEGLETTIRKTFNQPLLRNTAVGFAKRRWVARLFYFNTTRTI